VHGLGRPDAEQNAQHLGVVHALGERRVEAGSALLDRREVEPGGVGDRLEVLVGFQVVVRAWDGREASLSYFPRINDGS
jgi:hypothetical protein